MHRGVISKMTDRWDNGGKKALANRTRKTSRNNRVTPPRSTLDVYKYDYKLTVMETWNQLPLTTKLYFAIIAALLALLLLLVLVRSSSLTMSLGFLRILRGEEENAQITPASTTMQGLDIVSGKPAVVAQANAELRSGPATSYPAIGLLEIGQAIEVVGVSADGFWWAVRVPYIESERAWVASAQVQAHNTGGVEVIPLPAELLAATQSAANPAIATAIINVNIRSGPGMDYPKIGLLAEGQEADIVGVDADRFWYVIKVPGEINLQGWVSKDYVKVRNADGLPVVGPQTQTPMLIPLTIVNVRAGPGKEYAIIGSLETGQGAEVIGVSPDGEWWVIKFAAGENGQGWVSAEFVKVENAEGLPVIKQ